MYYPTSRPLQAARSDLELVHRLKLFSRDTVEELIAGLSERICGGSRGSEKGGYGVGAVAMNLHPAERKQNMVIFPVTFHIANHPAFRAVDSIGMCVGPSFLCFRGARELTRMLDQAVASSAEHATDRHTLNRANAAVDGYAFDPVASVPGGARGIPAGAVLVSTTEGDVKSGRCIRGVVLILLPISIQQRLQKELRMLKQDPVPGVHALVCHPRPLSSPCSRQQDARAAPPPLGHLICFELRHF